MSAERRRYPRVTEALRLQVRRGASQIATETINVSCGGTLCWLKTPLKPMTRVAVALALPKRLVHCTGVVIRCIRVGSRYQVGLFFTEISRQDHRAIAEFVLASILTHQRGLRGDHRRP